jgi:hypothetical protein
VQAGSLSLSRLIGLIYMVPGSLRMTLPAWPTWVRGTDARRHPEGLVGDAVASMVVCGQFGPLTKEASS